MCSEFIDEPAKVGVNEVVDHVMFLQEALGMSMIKVSPPEGNDWFVIKTLFVDPGIHPMGIPLLVNQFAGLLHL